jgi:hypothetical protein
MESRYQQLAKQMVTDEKLPQIVYRMRPVNRFLFESLISAQIWFSNPQDFNDPYDCDLDMRVQNLSVDRMKAYFENHLKNLCSPKELQDIQSKGLTFIDFEKLINRSAKQVIRRKGIACFMSSCDNLLMWSHYADSHKGVCLKFDILEDASFFTPAKKVNYSRDYPEYDYLTNKNDFVNQMFFTKSEDWAYEGEVRVLKNINGNYSFHPKSLKEVIFGCKISGGDKSTLTKLIKATYPACEFKQAVKDDRKFSLNFEVV